METEVRDRVSGDAVVALRRFADTVPVSRREEGCPWCLSKDHWAGKVELCPSPASRAVVHALSLAALSPVSNDGVVEVVIGEIERYGEGLVPELRIVCTWLASHLRDEEIRTEIAALSSSPTPIEVERVGGKYDLVCPSCRRDKSAATHPKEGRHDRDR